MKIIAYDAYLQQEQLPDYIRLEKDVDVVLRESDFISMHIPATKDTLDFINEGQLNKMKKSAGNLFKLPAKVFLVHRIISNQPYNLSDFPSASLSSIGVAPTTPHSFALHMKNHPALYG